MCRNTSLCAGRMDREGKVRSEGKIEGRGTRRGIRLGLHVGWRGTRQVWRGVARKGKRRWVKHLGRASSDQLRWGTPYDAL